MITHTTVQALGQARLRAWLLARPSPARCAGPRLSQGPQRPAAGGGELFLRGTVVPRKRPRGRPPKTEVAA